MRNFTFGGQSLSEFGGRIVQAPSHHIAKRRVERVKIYGQSGDEIIDGGAYDNVDFSMKVSFWPRACYPYLYENEYFSARQRARAVIDWLAPLQDRYFEYRDTYNPGYFTMAQLANVSEIVRELPTLLTATLQFSRLPYWYSDEGTRQIDLGNKSTVLVNPELYSAEPIVTFTYTGSAAAANLRGVVTVNDSTVRFSVSPTNNLHIFDSVEKQHYRTDDGVKTYLGLELLPELLTGENRISGGLENTTSFTSYSVSVIPNWRRL